MVQALIEVFNVLLTIGFDVLDFKNSYPKYLTLHTSSTTNYPT